MKKTIFVIGAGNGCGNHVARKFGKEDFRVVLMARSTAHLKEYEKEVQNNGIEVYTQQLDVSDPAEVTRTFGILKEKFGVPDVLFYNVGVTTPDSQLTEQKDVNLLMERYMTDVGGAYHAIQQILGDEFSEKQGAVLITGGGLSLYPVYEFLPLSMDKAALRAMCQALHEELKNQGVYVGTVTVTDVIAPGEKCDPEALADDFWDLYTARTEWERMH